jgi:hypothetical protein
VLVILIALAVAVAMAFGAVMRTFTPASPSIAIPDRLPCDFLLGCCRHELIAKFFRPGS